MSFVLGFGKTELEVQSEVKSSVIRALLRKESVGDVLKKWNDGADEYDKMPRETAPGRYTRIFFYGGKLHFHHINRNHAFSPDGWGLLMVEVPIEGLEKEQNNES